MPLFDFTDPNIGAIAGLIQGAGQAAIPTRVKTPIGATLGMTVGGMLQGAQQAQQMKQQDIQNQMLGRQNQVGSISMQNYLDTLPDGPQKAALQAQLGGAQPQAASQAGGSIFDRIGRAMGLSSAPPPALANANLGQAPAQLQLQQPVNPGPGGLAITPLQAYRNSMLFGAGGAGMAPLAAEQAKLITSPVLPNTQGGLTAVSGGANDPAYIHQAAVAKATGEQEQNVDAAGNISPISGSLPSKAAAAGATAGGAAAAETPYKEQQAAYAAQVDAQAKMAVARNQANLDNANTLMPVTDDNGNTHTMTRAQALPLAATSPNPVPDIKPGDTLFSPTGAIIPANPVKSTLPGIVQPSPENLKAWGEMSADAPQLAQVKMRVGAITQALKVMQSNPTADLQQEVWPILNQAGISVAPDKLNDAANAQVVIHDNLLQALDTLQEAKSRMSQASVKMTTEALNHPDLLPYANHTIAAQILGGVNAKQDMMRTIPAAQKMQWNPAQYQAAFYDKNPMQNYVDQAFKQIGPLKGEPGAAKTLSASDPRIPQAAKARGISVDSYLGMAKANGVIITP